MSYSIQGKHVYLFSIGVDSKFTKHHCERESQTQPPAATLRLIYLEKQCIALCVCHSEVQGKPMWLAKSTKSLLRYWTCLSELLPTFRHLMPNSHWSLLQLHSQKQTLGAPAPLRRVTQGGWLEKKGRDGAGVYLPRSKACLQELLCTQKSSALVEDKYLLQLTDICIKLAHLEACERK